MNTAFKVAAVQAAPVFLDLEASIDKAVGLIEEAAAQDVRVIAFPETWLPGYPWWIWLGAPAWGMQFLGELVQNSIEKGSPQEARLTAAAKNNNMHVIMGVSERAGGSLYMGQWHFGADGEIVNQRRKLKPTHVERTVFGESDGSGLHVSDTDCGRIGALCCWEHLQPLSKYAMYSQNEQIHCAAWPSFTLYEGIAYSLGWQVNTAASLMYAAEGQCFVLAACGVISDDMIAKLCDTEDKTYLWARWFRTGNAARTRSRRSFDSRYRSKHDCLRQSCSRPRRALLAPRCYTPDAEQNASTTGYVFCRRVKTARRVTCSANGRE